MRIALDGLDLEVLNPPDPSPLADENDRSLVFRAALGGVPVVFSGDLEARGETEMLRSGAVRAGFALLVPHHGAATPSSAAWVEAVAPRIALLSLGRGNRFGHPSIQVLGRYEARGVRVARTDLDGALLLRFGRRPALFRMRDGDWGALVRQ
jgi:competence protein ComEC